MLKRVLAFLAVVMLLTTACQQGGDGDGVAEGDFAGTTITFNISLAEEEKDTIQSLIDTFQTDTGAKVNLTSVTSADLPAKLEVEVGSGKPTIHLFAQDNLGLAVLVQKNLVEDLSDVEIPSEVLESMVPEKFDDKQLFLPFRPNVRVAYANKDRLASAKVEPPKTVQEFRSSAEKLRAQAGSGKVTLSLAEGDPAAVTISEWIVSYGGNPLILNDAGSVAAFEFLQKLWKDGLLAQESLLGKFDTEVDYLQGETAWLAQNWPFTSAELLKQDLLGKFEVYEGWTGPERAAHVVGGDVLGIPRGVTGKEKEAALGLAEFLMSKEAQETLAAEQAWPSIRDDAYAEVPDEQKETFAAIQAALEDGWYRPNVLYWSDASEQMNAAVKRVIVDGESVKTVLDELHAKIEAAAKAKGAKYPPASA